MSIEDRTKEPMITAHEAIAMFAERLLLRGVSLLDIEISANAVLKVDGRADLDALCRKIAVRALGPDDSKVEPTT